MLVWDIDPLPDFLSDHTLASTDNNERIRQVVSRWVQFVHSLWHWRDRAAFALRFHCCSGVTTIRMAAAPFVPVDQSTLQYYMDASLRAHRIWQNVQPKVAFDWAPEPPRAMVELGQFTTRSLWTLPRAVKANEQFKTDFGWLNDQDLDHPPVVYPWFYPGGAFLLPMEGLASQPGPCDLTIYLQPTTLKAHELRWLSEMAREAHTLSQRSHHALGTGAALRIADPIAELAGRLLVANFRRLVAHPYLVAVHCCAQNLSAARSLAGTFQATLHESPAQPPVQEDSNLPTGADQLGSYELGGCEGGLAYRQYNELVFEERLAAHGMSQRLWRLPYLADAAGAATAFRLPISMRSGVPGIRLRQVVPDFHPGPRVQSVPADHVLLGEFRAGGVCSLPVEDLKRHGLITGFTGSGKTMTAINILQQLWGRFRIPFLVVESAKQEYRSLIQDRTLNGHLQVFTIGNESCSPIRLNPFELLPGTRVESHISKLQTCFEAAIPSVGPSSSVISEALVRVYEQAGWQLTNVGDPELHSSKVFPTLANFIDELEFVVNSRGYEGEVRSNLRAAISGRLRPLLLGSKGRIFSSQRNFPSAVDLFTRPTVLELNDLNLNDKALFTMLFLVLMREYRENNPSSRLQHVALVEEAHNVVASVHSQAGGESSEADTRYKAVEAFCQLIAEVRAYGQGILLADQSPSKLARDAIRNSNLLLVHQMRDAEDAELMARTMLMDNEQQRYVAKLPPGQASVFFSGLEQPSFISIPNYTFASMSEGAQTGRLTDQAVHAYMQRSIPGQNTTDSVHLPFSGCQFCRRQCDLRQSIATVTLTLKSRSLFQAWREQSRVAANDLAACTSKSQDLMALCKEQLDKASLNYDSDNAWCWLMHTWNASVQPELASRCTRQLYERMQCAMNESTAHA